MHHQACEKFRLERDSNSKPLRNQWVPLLPLIYQAKWELFALRVRYIRTLWSESLFVFLVRRRIKKRRFYLNRVDPLQSPKPELLDWSVLFSLVKLVCSECEHRFIDKPTVVTEPTVPSARLKGLGSKLYPKTKIFLEYFKSSKWTALRLERCNIHDDDEDMKGGIRNFLLLLLFAEEWLNAWKNIALMCLVRFYPPFRFLSSSALNPLSYIFISQIKVRKMKFKPSVELDHKKQLKQYFLNLYPAYTFKNLKKESRDWNF